VSSQLIAETVLPSISTAASRELFRDAASASAFLPSPEALAREISGVLALELSSELQGWAKRYADVGHRDPFLWNWARRGVEVTTLSSVDPSLRDLVCDTRVLGIMLDVMLDDIADNQKDLRFLEHLLGVLEFGGRFNPASIAPQQRLYARFTVDLWREIQDRARRFPRHDEFAELLRFDYRQLFNVMRYSRLLDEYPEMQNLVEHDLYTPHNMHMMISATMDLMCSPEFDRSELGILREAVWRAQCMGRIGNLVTTWQREIGENDFSSGVFARALACGDLSVGDLADTNRTHLESVIVRQKHEEYFLERWQVLRREILSLQARCHSVNLAALASGLERLICLHLGSRGKK
jgi:hypothetical protein